jgi:hypothetical protein
MTKSEFENPKGFNLEDLERFVNILCERSLSAATQRSLIFQFRKIKKENEVLKQVVREMREGLEDLIEASECSGIDDCKFNPNGSEYFCVTHYPAENILTKTTELLEKEGIEL